MIGLRGRARDVPWPYNTMIGGLGYMMAEDENGQIMVSTRPPNQDDVVPTDYGADASNPSFGKWQLYSDLAMGFGKKVQQLVQDRKSFRAFGVDTSQSYKIIMGPEIIQVTPSTVDATTGILDFFEIGGALYAVAGQYCLRRVADNNFSLGAGRDFGGGNKARRGTAVFTNNATGVQYAFIPQQGANRAYYFDGVSTWTQFATYTALCFCQVGREFFRASDTNLVSKVDTNADPTNELNWSAANEFRVGDKSSEIIRMWADANGVLLILKTDGIYSIAGDGQDIPYFAKLLKQGTGVDNGKVVWSFENDTFTMYNGVTYQLTTDFKLTPVGPELAPGNDSELTGYISAGLGHQTFNAYGMLYNPDGAGTSYLMKYRTYTNVSFGLGGSMSPTAKANPQDVWVGSISQPFVAMKGQIMWESAIGAAAGHTRAWIGFSNGNYAYYTLPCSQDPTGCTWMRFSTVTSTLDPPFFTGTFPGNNKVLMRAKVAAIQISDTQYVEIGYSHDCNPTSFTDWGTRFTRNGQSADLDTPFAGNLIPLRFTFANDDPLSTPVTTAIEILWALQYDDLRQVYVLEVLAEDGLVARDGRPLRRTASDMRSALQAAGSASAGMTIALPDEDIKNLRLIKLGERTVQGGRVRRWQKTVHIEAAEVADTQVYGTVARLAAYLVGDLSGFTIGTLEGI